MFLSILFIHHGILVSIQTQRVRLAVNIKAKVVYKMFLITAVVEVDWWW